MNSRWNESANTERTSSETPTTRTHFAQDSHSTGNLISKDVATHNTRDQTKKAFLKKHSRKFLACSNPSSASTTTVLTIPSTTTSMRTSTYTHPYSAKQNPTPTPRLHSQYQPIKSQNSCPNQPTLTHIQPPIQQKCVPPQLWISRQSGKLLQKQETPEVTREVFDDGRVRLVFKKEGIVQQCLSDIQLTQFSSGDFKLQWGDRSLYWNQQLKVCEVDGKLQFE